MTCWPSLRFPKTINLNDVLSLSKNCVSLIICPEWTQSETITTNRWLWKTIKTYLSRYEICSQCKNRFSRRGSTHPSPCGPSRGPSDPHTKSTTQNCTPLHAHKRLGSQHKKALCVLLKGEEVQRARTVSDFWQRARWVEINKAPVMGRWVPLVLLERRAA